MAIFEDTAENQSWKLTITIFYYSTNRLVQQCAAISATAELSHGSLRAQAYLRDFRMHFYLL